MSAAASGVSPDYYAVLQVHPRADPQVIDAAYRQLMKIYHPDLAGVDPQRVAEHQARAKAINQAYAVLRDPEQRRRYDFERQVSATRPRPSRPPSADAASRATSVPSIDPDLVHVTDRGTTLPMPLSLLVTAYYLLPGRYEWEDGQGQELLTVFLVPLLGLLGFALWSGRLTPWIGHSLPATLLAWAVVGVLTVPLWPSLPRIALAGVPTLALVTGTLNPYLEPAHVPTWFAWAILSALSVLLAARQYVFSILPTLGLCWLLAHVT